MAAELTNNAPQSEKELKEELKVDNGQDKEKQEAPAEEKCETKADDKKAEPLPPKPSVHKANFQKDIVYVYQFTRSPQLPSTSPYCLKLETWLRLTGVKYENVEHKSKFRSKKGQLPFVELNGEEICDSAFIIKALTEKFDKNLDADLTKDQRMLSHALVSMIENHLSWAILWWRAKYPESVIKGYKINLQNTFNTRLPTPILKFCYKLTSGRKGLMKARAHGLGVHKQEEIVELGMADLRVLSDLLADKPFFFGNEPTLLDVVAFANLAQLYYLSEEVNHPLRDAMNQGHSNLVGLVSRVKERAFPDWDTLCSTLELNTHLPKPAKEVPDTKEGCEPAEKKPLPEEPEKEKGDEKEIIKESDEKKDTEKEK